MYIEALHDSEGNILGCYCADTLPINSKKPLFTLSEMPANTEQARINIDTLTAMEIDQKSGNQPVIEDGAAKIVEVDRSTYIRENYLIDMSQEIPAPNIELPEGFKMRALIKK